MRRSDHEDEVVLIDVVEVVADSPPPPPSLLGPHVAPIAVPVVEDSLVCIRLNCEQQGLPTDQRRCGQCGHRTQPAELNRWPRHLTY